MRPMALRRSWLFVGAADQAAILASYDSQADACIQEFEDFCVPEMREEARRIMPDVLSDWKDALLWPQCVLTRWKTQMG